MSLGSFSFSFTEHKTGGVRLRHRPKDIGGYPICIVHMSATKFHSAHVGWHYCPYTSIYIENLNPASDLWLFNMSSIDPFHSLIDLYGDRMPHISIGGGDRVPVREFSDSMWMTHDYIMIICNRYRYNRRVYFRSMYWKCHCRSSPLERVI